MTGSRSNHNGNNREHNANPNVPPRPVLQRENTRNYHGIHDATNGPNIAAELRRAEGHTARTTGRRHTARRQGGNYKKRNQKKRKSIKRHGH